MLSSILECDTGKVFKVIFEKLDKLDEQLPTHPLGVFLECNFLEKFNVTSYFVYNK